MKITQFMACILLTFLACKSDNQQKKSELTGRWDVTTAEFNGQPAPFLERFYFDFKDKQLTTNFNEAVVDETAEFEVKAGIIIKKTTPSVNFKIETQTDSTIDLTTDMQGNEFRLHLSKTIVQ